jgi:hypothetical protein
MRCETCQSLNMDSVANMLSFPMPTDTHLFAIHSNGYGHLNAANVWSSVDCWKSN